MAPRARPGGSSRAPRRSSALLEKTPFPDHPPRYLRAVLYDYHFTDFAARRATGAWWRREETGLYLPVLTREMLRR